KASAAQFLLQGLGGHLLGTSELLGGSSTVWDITYNGTSFASAAYTGTLPAQAEDGIFVSAQRITDTGSPGPGPTPFIGGWRAAVCHAGSPQCEVKRTRARVTGNGQRDRTRSGRRR